jgi:hypothetical protein
VDSSSTIGFECCLSPDNKDKDEIDDDTAIVDGYSDEHKKSWLIEWKKSFGKTTCEEKYDYTRALAIFDEKTADGIDAILYEVQKSPHDSSIVKKTPILNSSKARQRKKEEHESTKNWNQAKQSEKGNNKSGSIRYRIILLIAVIGVLVLVISLISALTNKGGIMVNPHVVIAIVETTVSTTLQIIQVPDAYVMIVGLAVMNS